MRAGLETSITRTPLASTHILSVLSGCSAITVPCLASALVALFITLKHPFIMSQRDRQDMALKVGPARPVASQHTCCMHHDYPILVFSLGLPVQRAWCSCGQCMVGVGHMPLDAPLGGTYASWCNSSLLVVIIVLQSLALHRACALLNAGRFQATCCRGPARMIAHCDVHAGFR